ncbi:MAG TPA: L-histidine N(alpha)-methyltransferase [Salinivirga sp.]|uniref:L-histidine N(alpha)-methyltransferase n=1 Tax=Salinivirga sp. TaxID=1970192 RepID=UPI002B460509|nr:L-histidine N(alpha)-methyltransferase [Salinivirga sp.]HKK60548.1 L-histidine N(alpha)-methyltransferase [Salinivirga sp.]
MTVKTIDKQLLADVVQGLTYSPKYLESKYFYDDEGSRIFQQIMQMPEYYLTNCEYEIFDRKADEILDWFAPNKEPIDIIELGAGDGYKTRVLLEHFISKSADVRYLPVDISEEANRRLLSATKKALPELYIKPYTGDFFEVLSGLQVLNNRRKIFLFLGSSIGNFDKASAVKFFKHIGQFMSANDLLLVGFDLKKDPDIVLPAYDDPHGYTAAFNLNLLKRINRELDADFNLADFKHYATYNPISGDAKSYLISLKSQKVNIGVTGQTLFFDLWEPIFMEISQKYDSEMIQSLARDSGFSVVHSVDDQKHYFRNSLWKKI